MKEPGLTKARDKYDLAFFLLLLLFAFHLLRTAWLSDDSMITLRSAMNFVNGFGPTFNIDERVQAFTHPLWFFILSALAAITNQIFMGTAILSMAISVLVFYLFWAKLSTNRAGAVTALFALIFSKAFMDYSTSGLENPLSHFLLLMMILLGPRNLKKTDSSLLAVFFLNCSLLFLTRADLLLVAFPLTVYICSKNITNPGGLLKAFLLGAIPAAVWICFSLYYYGSPLPNTAYAKLGTGISKLEYIRQGLYYLLDSIERDPITLATVIVGFALGLFSNAFHRCLAAGIAFYLMYIVYIGGDFMSGRFFTVPLLLAVSIISQTNISSQKLIYVVLPIAVLGFYNMNSTILVDNLPKQDDIKRGVTDERRYYQLRGFGLIDGLSLFNLPPWTASMDVGTTRERPVEILCGGLGNRGLSAGPQVHFIDTCALADPLLARLPARYEPNWTVGHFRRRLPENYEISIARDANLLTDPSTYRFYDSIRLITRGQLTDINRLREVWRLNTGQLEKPDWSMYRNQEIGEIGGRSK